MWINNNISKPLRKGEYKTLVDFDGLGNLKEYKKEYYNGLEWDWCMSNAQFIRFWLAEKEDYMIISDKIEAEITRVGIGYYQLDKIKANTTYVITHLEGEDPKIEKKDGK
jgi:hypothetical protein